MILPTRVTKLVATLEISDLVFLLLSGNFEISPPHQFVIDARSEIGFPRPSTSEPGSEALSPLKLRRNPAYKWGEFWGG